MTCRRALASLAFLLNLPGAAIPPAPRFLLPDVAEPRRYALDLTLFPGEAVFRGVAGIDLELKEKVSFLWLNGKDLTVDSAVLSARGQSIAARAVPSGGEFLGFALPRPVGPGPAHLEIRYQGKLGDREPVGAFRKRSAGDWYVFTSFTAIDARRAFPCFDEPRYKTPWQLTLHVKHNQVALSNTSPTRETEEPNGMKRVVFGATRPLPSSLVAFAVGPFDVVNAGRAGKNGTEVRIITPRGRGPEAAAALGATGELLARLEEYTGIAYPFQKLDHLALLEGAFGATEYPGLITYQQRILLARGERDTTERRRRMRAVMAHELAHQWFGNLVTMSGWQDVWLSEGFATWMSAKVMDESEPPARSGVLAVAARNGIMASDLRPVRLAMASREEMRDVYGRVVYQKGAATLAMLEHWMGDGEFQRGIRTYLAAHQFATATTADFVRAMSQSAGQDVGEILSSFLDRTGYPVVTAKIRCDSGSSPRVALRQDRHAPRGAPSDASLWRLPVCVKVDGAAGRCVVMETRETEMVLTDVKACPSWVFPNAGASGYYRTNPGSEMLQPLWSDGAGQLTAAERLTLALDVAAMVASGSLKPAQAFTQIPKMAQDDEPLVSLTALGLAGGFTVR